MDYEKLDWHLSNTLGYLIIIFIGSILFTIIFGVVDQKIYPNTIIYHASIFTMTISFIFAICIIFIGIVWIYVRNKKENKTC